jgi:hypothetical protein
MGVVFTKANQALHNLLYFFTDCKQPVDCKNNNFGCGHQDLILNDVLLYIYKKHVDDRVERIVYDTDNNDGCLYFNLDFYKIE